MMKRLRIAVVLVITLLAVPGAQAAEKLRIGVTLHPYYSFVMHIVDDLAETVPIIPAGANSHGYLPVRLNPDRQ